MIPQPPAPSTCGANFPLSLLTPAADDAREFLAEVVGVAAAVGGRIMSPLHLGVSCGRGWMVLVEIGESESAHRLRVRQVDPEACVGYVDAVKVRTISFEALQRDKRRARKRDERRLALGEVTPEQLQEENSLVPRNAKITIPDFCITMERYFGK